MITDPDEIGFRRAIVAEPHDDTPRLVYADWLQEHGQDERAEFIRLQCRLARMAEDLPDFAAMRKREEKLLRKNKRRWTKPLPWRWRSAEFQRGFLRGKYHHHPGGFAEAVTQTELEIPAWHLALWQSFRPYDWQISGELRRVDSLEVRWTDPHSAPLEGIVGCPHLINLDTLSIETVRLEPYTLAELFDAGPMPRLSDLTVRHDGFRDDHIMALTESDVWPGLRSLALQSQSLGPSAISELTVAGVPRGLRTLALQRGSFGDEGVERLLTWAAVATLTSLSMSYCGLADVGATAIALSPDLDNLRSLDLSGNMIGPAGARALAESGSLGNLERLDLRRNPISGRPEARRILRSRFGDRVLL